MNNRTAKIITLLMAAPALILPAACLLFILGKGLKALNWQVLAGGGVNGFGLGGGLWGQISGSLLLMSGACLLAAPVALGVALYFSLHAGTRAQTVIMVLLHLLQGIPPIVYGLCGLIVFVHILHWGVSLAAGMVILGVIILPLLILNTVHALERVPKERTEAARALGLSDSRLIRRVWLPEAWPAMLTGLLLGMARALSETAPILFTATVFSGVVWPDSVFSPVTSLQTHIFYLAQEGADPRAVDVAWASATVLIGLVLLFGLSALAFRTWKVK